MKRSLALVAAVLCVAAIVAVQIGITATEPHPCPFCGTWVCEILARWELHITISERGLPYLDVVEYVYKFGSTIPAVQNHLGVVASENALVMLSFADTTAFVSCFRLTGEDTFVGQAMFMTAGATIDTYYPLCEGGSCPSYVYHRVPEAPAISTALSTGSHFTGNADMVTDSFTLPAGAYRVHVVTAGYLMAKAISLATPADYTLLFLITPGRATSGASALYVSAGQPIVMEFSIVSAPYELWFEKVK